MTVVQRKETLQLSASETLDPADWSEIRAQGHRMLDDMFDYVAQIRERPVWSPIPEDVRAGFRGALPRQATDLGEVYREFADHVVPYATGNVHPGFMGWVHGGGTAVGMLAEMLAAGLNANLGGRDHMPIEVERQVVEWMRSMFDFPAEASGIFVTGTSMANLMAVLVARTSALGQSARQHGIGQGGALLTAYTSKAAHGCISKAMDIAGFGSDGLRQIPVDECHRIDVAALRAQISRDREAGLKPFLVVGSAGTVDIGAVDDLIALSALCREEKLWFHVDGAYGALGILSPEIRPRLAGIEAADSIALDFHKWGQVPYDAGFLLVRDGEAASRDVRGAGGLSASRDPRSGRRFAMALRSRAGSVARLPRPEDLVHFESLWHREARRRDHADLRAGGLSGGADPGRAEAGIDGAGSAQHRLLPLSRGRLQSEWRHRRRYSGVRDRGAIDDGARRQTGDPSCDRQSSHRYRRHRCADRGGA